ncbi:ATP-binding protein [Pelagicoccus mobilis]|uniref:ATP-binding protein n=1 Tax=Pelagicoccus mobilis TaxID=415221 RepID=A0A934S0I8_9BACT|nr:ATP-binding protein [Pelagicoccus mobilis]MBK1879688.1 ATP-binding protein [Pelagicoccus mobilis]
MRIPQSDLLAVLRNYNPWWQNQPLPDLPNWKRAAYYKIAAWAAEPPAGRALLLSGARQVGKTTLFLQAIQELLDQKIPPGNILYATLDHPLLKLAGLEQILEAWQEREPRREGPLYLFIDEIQSAKDWQTWIKHQVDFHKGQRRIAVTGSATPLVTENQESGVGRWQTIKLATLSFYEYLQIRSEPVPTLPQIRSLRQLFDWKESNFQEVSHVARPIIALFHEYLLRSGFPQCSTISSITLSQKLLREDIVDKVLKRDMTALFGVRRVLEIEQVFLYLCMHDGGLLDLQELCQSLELKRPTVSNFIDLLEATHLIYRLRPYGYGKQILRAKSKVYLADAAISPSTLLKGKSLLDDPIALGQAAETAFFKHLFTRYYDQTLGFSYWQNKKKEEVDLIVDLAGRRTVPFEIKYRSPNHTKTKAFPAMQEFCQNQKIEKGYIITREIDDFKTLQLSENLRIQKIPAALACYWLGQSEIDRL